MSTRVRWEGVDEVGKMKSSSERLAKSTKQTIAIICSAVKNLGGHHQQQTAHDEEAPIEAFKAAEIVNPDKIEILPDNNEIQKDTEQEPKKEDDALLESGNSRNHHRPEPIKIPAKLPLSSMSSFHSNQVSPAFPSPLPDPASWKHDGKRGLVDMLSALYGIVLVLMGVAFPISQMISNDKMPTSYYQGFYSYLYFVAIAFFAYVYLLLKTQLTFDIHWKKNWNKMLRWMGIKKDETADNVFQFSTPSEIMTNRLRAKLGAELDPTRSANMGSFYLRIGAVVFGVGSMIYSGLEFGQYFEMTSNPDCDDIMLAVQPLARLLFTFFQMYFVFLNAKLQIIKGSNIVIGRFGLMHMVATNLCLWVNLIVQETMHELHSGHHDGAHGSDNVHHDELPHGAHPHQSPLEVILHVVNTTLTDEVMNADHHHHAVARRSAPAAVAGDCHQAEVMGSLTQNAGPFLFPCAIEYSLICAAIFYEIWKHTGHGDHGGGHHEGTSTSGSPSGSRTPHTPNSLGSARRSPHHYSVDCTNANKGLFFGIFVLVLTIISMILFLVLINREEFKDMAVTEVHLSELILYLMTLAAVLIGMIQVSQLRFDSTRKLDLDNILLIVALTGVISYNIFTIIGTQFTTHLDSLLTLVNALAALVQGILQTVFVLDASKRTLYTRRQLHRKPGREVITFLMVTNFAMWAVITLEKSRSDAHPVQSDFFGQLAWTIITNISSPLAIFYRYHSTVCMCEIWKRCYKLKE